MSEKKRGRPTKFTDEMLDQAFKLCLLGATDEQIANFFNVSVPTIDKWKQSKPDFLQALSAGKEQADARVAESLYNRALGYSHPEDKIFNDNGAPLIVPTTKHYPPDTTAAIFWLKNRQKAAWRDKQDFEHTGKDGAPLTLWGKPVGEE
jgi:hypothetical protein